MVLAGYPFDAVGFVPLALRIRNGPALKRPIFLEQLPALALVDLAMIIVKRVRQLESKAIALRSC